MKRGISSWIELEALARETQVDAGRLLDLESIPFKADEPENET